MIRFVYGSSGSGKTTLLTEWIRADLEIGKKVLLLVPEQASVAAEISMTRALAGVPTVSLEILNFTLAKRCLPSLWRLGLPLY